MTLERYGIYISYLIGVPIGLIAIFIVFSIPVMLTGEGLATIALVGIYGKAMLGLIISFLIALGVGGYKASAEIQKQKSLLKTSFKYSLTVNAIIWSVFVLVTALGNEGKNFLVVLIIPFFAFISCTITTTFTIGLLICYTIKRWIIYVNNYHTS